MSGVAGKSTVYRSDNVRIGVLAGAVVFAVPIVGLGVDLVRRWRWPDAVIWAALVVFAALLLWRIWRLGVVVADDYVQIRNFARTRTLPLSEIEKFVVDANDGLPAEMAYVRLRDGRRIKLEAVGTSQFITAGERLSVANLVERLNELVAHR
jgi:hypothetical protein